jgi:hypothetical protein
VPSVLYTSEVEHGALAAHVHRPPLGSNFEIRLGSGGRACQVDPLPPLANDRFKGLHFNYFLGSARTRLCQVGVMSTTVG